MNIEKINRLIVRLRQGDQEAEILLYNECISRIRIYVHYNVWTPDVKDPENLIQEVWLKLKGWFVHNDVISSEKSVIFNQVRSLCRSQALKDKREPDSGNEPLKDPGFDKESGGKDKDSPSVHEEIFKNIFVNEYGHSNVPEKERLFLARFKATLSKCLKNLTDRQCDVINKRFYLGMTLQEIGDTIGTTLQAARDECNKAIGKLKRCFQRNNIRSVGDLK
jgi:RNA polymerase sigma factor (sigma-70 family)